MTVEESPSSVPYFTSASEAWYPLRERPEKASKTSSRSYGGYTSRAAVVAGTNQGFTGKQDRAAVEAYEAVPVTEGSCTHKAHSFYILRCGCS